MSETLEEIESKVLQGKYLKNLSCFQTHLPELYEFEEVRVIRRQIVVLPDERVQYVDIVGHSVKELCRCQTVALQHQFGFALLHADLQICCKVSSGYHETCLIKG